MRRWIARHLHYLADRFRNSIMCSAATHSERAEIPISELVEAADEIRALQRIVAAYAAKDGDLVCVFVDPPTEREQEAYERALIQYG